MAHRALIAVERRDGQFDCIRSQWGGLAAFESGPSSVVDDAIADHPAEATELSVPEVLDLLDPLADEALVVTERDGTTTAYLVVRLGIVTGPSAEPSAPAVLVPVEDETTSIRLRPHFRATKAVLGDAVDAGLIPRHAARTYLETAVARHPDVSANAIWLDPNRE